VGLDRGKERCIERKKDTYTTYLHPEDYKRFLENLGTSIPRKRRLIELSMRVMQYYIDEIRSRDDWWMICRVLQKAIGKV